ncbi:MAG: hypothetical protein IKK08_00545 [Clostridia bacterium]|nr:hypothetical protein [Clostridia bacterium]
MNKLFRLTAVALVCALLLSLAPAALADTCYESLKNTFSIEENGDFAFLGPVMLLNDETLTSEEVNGVFFHVFFTDGYATLVGRNADGQPEVSVWIEPDPGELMLACVQVAASYEVLCTSLDQCDKLTLIMELGEEVGNISIASPEDAQAFLMLIQSELGGDDVVAVPLPEQEEVPAA